MKNKTIILLSILILALFANNVLAARDSDLDGIPDNKDQYPFDFDNDGMPDIWERKSGLRYDAEDADEDPDNDGVVNLEEYKRGTDPLLSDKTGKTVGQAVILSPAESMLFKVLIWILSGLLIIGIILFLIYKKHISRILKFVHHVSKKHFEGQGTKKAPQTRRPAPYTQRQVMRSRVVPPPKRFYKTKYKRKAAPKEEEKPKKEGFILLGDIKKKRKKNVFERLKELVRSMKRKEDVFRELSDDVRKQKKIEAYKKGTFGRLAKIK